MTGEIASFRGWRPDPIYSGALSAFGVYKQLPSIAVGDVDAAFSFNINASRSSSLYAGADLQPSALQTLACIRI